MDSLTYANVAQLLRFTTRIPLIASSRARRQLTMRLRRTQVILPHVFFDQLRDNVPAFEGIFARMHMC
ncbi:hypothetical protein VTO73DRAFT_12298 [Trametes versicolor]